MRTNAKRNGMAMMAGLALLATAAFGDNEAYRQAGSVPSPQAVLLGKGSVAVALPAEGRVVVIDSMDNVTAVGETAALNSIRANTAAPGSAFKNPTALAVDTKGNLFVADTGNHRIRRVDAVTNVVSTVAGTGEAGFDGDFGPATSAALDTPSGIALDNAGNLFIADTANHRIRRVDASTGIITTYAGTGDADFDADDVPAIAGHLNTPTGLAYDSWRQRLLVADTGNHAVRSITSDGTLHTFAGTGHAGSSGDGGSPQDARFLAPTGVGFTPSAGYNSVFVTDSGSHVVRRIDSETQIQTVASTLETQLPNLSAALRTAWKVTITAPTSSHWLVGSKQIVRWTHNLGAGQTFAVELSRDGGLTFETLKNVVAAPTSGSYTWTVTQPTTGAALLRVRSLGARNAYDVSSATIVVFVPQS